MTVFSSALLLGFVHGLGADHLMAIAALSIGSGAVSAGRMRAFGVAVRFAIGHALLLAAGAALVFALGWQIPTVLERGGEVAGGLLLILLGGAGLWVAATGRLYAHSHPHGAPPHAHWHLHLGRSDRHPRPSAHSHVPTLVGAVFATSGLRALALLLPAGQAGWSGTDTAAAVAGLVLLFALGILLAMALFGVLLAHVLSSRFVAAFGRLTAALTAAASVALGLYWTMT